MLRRMARAPRIDIQGLTYHVWANAITGASLFRDRDDKDRALAMLRDEVAISGWTCLAYVLMSTHYHVLLRLREPTLSRGLQRMNLRYARSYNAKYSCRGHVFNGPFGAKIVEGPAEELEVARYIALNPTRANMCRLPEDYPWSSYGSVIGMYPKDPIVDLSAALAPVGGSRLAYRRYVEELDPRVRRGQVRLRSRTRRAKTPKPKLVGVRP